MKSDGKWDGELIKTLTCFWLSCVVFMSSAWKYHSSRQGACLCYKVPLHALAPFCEIFKSQTFCFCAGVGGVRGQLWAPQTLVRCSLPSPGNHRGHSFWHRLGAGHWGEGLSLMALEYNLRSSCVVQSMKCWLKYNVSTMTLLRSAILFCSQFHEYYY